MYAIKVVPQNFEVITKVTDGDWDETLLKDSYRQSQIRQEVRYAIPNYNFDPTSPFGPHQLVLEEMLPAGIDIITN